MSTSLFNVGKLPTVEQMICRLNKHYHLEVVGSNQNRLFDLLPKDAQNRSKKLFDDLRQKMCDDQKKFAHIIKKQSLFSILDL